MAIQWGRLRYSFSHAIRGITEAWETQQNFRIHIIISILVLILSIVLKLTLIEFVFIFISVMFVIVSELLNTSIEYFADFVESNYNSTIKTVKDISAAAVLISVFTSIVAGSLIFLPKIYCLIFC